jgi:hypothetical protein
MEVTVRMGCNLLTDAVSSAAAAVQTGMNES